MKFGLGIGLTKTFGESAPTEASWNGWDGTNDGSVTNFFTDGGYGPANVAGFSDTQALIVTNEQTADDLWGLIVTRSSTSLSGGTVTKISEGAETVGQKASVDYLTLTRAIVSYEVDSSSNQKVALLDVSGANPSVLDRDVNGNTGTSAVPSKIIRHTDTLAVWISENGTTGSGHTIQTVDATSDSITLGTQLVMTNGATECMGCRLTDTTGFILDNTGINHYTISGGSAPTLNGANLVMSPDGNSFSDRTVTRIDNTRGLIIYRDSTDNKVYAQVVTWNGTAIIRGNVLEIRSSDNIQTQDNGWSCTVNTTDGNTYAWVTYQRTSVDTKGVASVLRVRDIATLELLNTEVQTFSSIQADHPTCTLFPDGDDIYLLTICQDETTSPVKQVAAKVIQGTGDGNAIPTVGTDWVGDISTLSETGARLDTNPPMTAGQGVDIHPSGTKIWQCGTNPDEVHEYTLSTAWDPSSAGSATQFDLNGTDNCFDMQWSSDGMVLWTLMDGSTQYIQQYTAATTPYDVSDLTYDTAYTFTEDSNPKSFWVDGADTNFYINGQTNDTIFQYSMSSAADMGTASYASKSYNYGGTVATAYGMAFNADKTQFFLGDGTSVFNFDLTTAGDVSGTVTPNGSGTTYVVGSSSLRGFSIRQDNGSMLFFANPNTDFIHTYGMISN